MPMPWTYRQATRECDFAQVLPSVLRALFVAEWRLDAAPLPPGNRADWTTEASTLRPYHNLTPPNCIEAKALALRKSIRREDLDRVLAALPPFAAEFWSTPGIDPATLGPSIV